MNGKIMWGKRYPKYPPEKVDDAYVALASGKERMVVRIPVILYSPITTINNWFPDGRFYLSLVCSRVRDKVKENYGAFGNIDINNSSLLLLANTGSEISCVAILSMTVTL